MTRDCELDMASLCDLINTHCRECGVVEAGDYTLERMRAAVDRIVFKQRTQLAAAEARVAETIQRSTGGICHVLCDTDAVQTCPWCEIERLRSAEADLFDKCGELQKRVWTLEALAKKDEGGGG